VTAAWETRNLGDICRVIGGGTPPKDRPEYYSGDIPWATVRDLRQEIITETEYKITKQAVKSSATNIIPKGNVVIATRVGLGKVCMLGQDTAINQDLRGIVPNNTKILAGRFLFWWLKSVAHLIEQEGTGATVKGVKLPFVKSLQVPVPPPPEQLRIVGTLDEAFDRIATAKANAEKNLQHSRALFASYLESAFPYGGDGWVQKPLGTLASFRNGINFTKGSRGEHVKIVGVKDFQKSFWVPSGNLDSVTIDGKLSEEDILKRGDILTVRSNGNPELIGRCILARNISEKISHSGFTIRIRLLTDELLPEYVCHFMKSTSSRKRLTDGGTGVNIKSLNQQTLSGLCIPYPPASKQKAIVANLESISEQTQRLESIYQQKLAALEAFKKSLLHQAFTGDL
jgi:type I restriction enzyme S subunit